MLAPDRIFLRGARNVYGPRALPRQDAHRGLPTHRCARELRGDGHARSLDECSRAYRFRGQLHAGGHEDSAAPFLESRRTRMHIGARLRSRRLRYWLCLHGATSNPFHGERLRRASGRRPVPGRVHGSPSILWRHPGHPRLFALHMRRRDGRSVFGLGRRLPCGRSDVRSLLRTSHHLSHARFVQSGRPAGRLPIEGPAFGRLLHPEPGHGCRQRRCGPAHDILLLAVVTSQRDSWAS